jgi:CYTH domain-containing protein
MAKEIERKFLVRNDGWRESVVETIRLRQAYIASMDDRSVRVRLADDAIATLTVKIGKRMTRDEFEYTIPIGDAEQLMATAVGVAIVKTRHKVPYKGFVWEVDVFDGLYEGLKIAEVEMRHEDDDPALPDWLGEEVTGQHRYSNQALAMRFEPDDPGL